MQPADHASTSTSTHQHHGLASPSLAATTLSDLLYRTTSKGDKVPVAHSHGHSHLGPLSVNKRASKSDSLLSGPALAGTSSSALPNSDLPSTSQGLQSVPSKSASTNNKSSSWLQRNKITKSLFSFNGPLASSTLTGKTIDSGAVPGSATSAHATCARKNCPVNHAAAAHHPLASFFTPLTRRNSEPGSPFASPAIYYSDSLDPFEESFSKSATSPTSMSGSSTLKNSSAATGTSVRGGNGTPVARRPSLGTSITAPPVISSPSPGPDGLKPQDYSGFAGFLFALHNQRKGSASAGSNLRTTGTSSPLSANNAGASATKEGKRRSIENVYSTPGSSESGYDAQDEDHSRLDGGATSTFRGRGRTSRRPNAISALVNGMKENNSDNKTDNTTTTVKPALLKERLNNVVRASNDRPSPSGDASPTSEISPARSTGNNGGKPRGFLFSRGNAFKNSTLVNQSTDETEDEVEEVKISPSTATSKKKPQKEEMQIEAVVVKEEGAKSEQAPVVTARGRTGPAVPQQRARHNHSTSVGEGSQYIVNLRASGGPKSRHSLKEEKGEDSSEELTLSDDGDSPERDDIAAQQAAAAQPRGRPTARRRSSANGRVPVVSPFTALERANTFANGEEKQHQLQTEDVGRGRSRARGSAALHRSVSPARSSSRARGRDSPRLRNR